MTWPLKTEFGLGRSAVRPALCVSLFTWLVACGAPEPKDSYTVDQPPLSDSPEVLHSSPGKKLGPVIEAYRDYLRVYPESLRREQVLRRLADLEVAHASSLTAALGDTPASESSTAEEARGYFHSAVLHYQSLLAEYPAQRKNSDVLYQLARAQDGSGSMQQATETLNQIAVTDEPTLYADSRFRQGEARFSEGDYADAEALYRSAAAPGAASPLYRQAQYKLGWALYKQKRYPEAILAMGELLDHILSAYGESVADEPLAALSRADREQFDDSLRALSLSFSELGGAGAVSAHFDRIGRRPYQTFAYLDLAALYLEEERIHDAAETYVTLANETYPATEAAPYAARAVEIYEVGGLQTRALEAKREYVDRFGPASGYWSHRDQAHRPGLKATAERFLLDLAVHYDGRAQRSGDREAYAQALGWYRRYLASFDADTQAAEVRYRLGELQFTFGDLEAAIGEFSSSAYDYEPHRYSADAGYGSVLSAESLLLDATDRALEHRRQQFLAVAVRFSDTFPSHAQATAVLLRAAQEELIAGNPNVATDLANRVLLGPVAASPDQRQGAWVVYARSQSRLENFAEAERGYRQAVAVSQSAESDGERLRADLAEVILQQGQRSLQSKDAEAAAKHFSRASAAAPSGALRAEADYRSAEARLAAQDWRTAAQELEAFRRRHPEDPRYLDATRQLAIAYEELERPLDAAQALEDYASRTDSEQPRLAASLRAATLYQEAGRPDSAIVVLQHYLDLNGAPSADRVEVQWSLASLSHVLGDESARRHWLVGVIAEERRAGSRSTRQARLRASEATLALAQIENLRFESARLASPLTTTLVAKTRYMNAALELYESVQSYEVSENTSAAIFYSAELYRHLATSLRDWIRSADVPVSQLQEYDALISSRSEAFTNKAVSIHESNLERARRGLHDPWVERSVDRLAMLVPGRYDRRERSERYVTTPR